MGTRVQIDFFEEHGRLQFVTSTSIWIKTVFCMHFGFGITDIELDMETPQKNKKVSKVHWEALCCKGHADMKGT